MGEMVLPCVNGPSEGLLLLSVSCLISGLVAPSFWSEFIIIEFSSVYSICPPFFQYFDMDSSKTGSITPGFLLIGFGLIVSVSTSISQVYSVVRDADKLGFHIVDILYDMSPFLVYGGSAYLWIIHSPIALRGTMNSLLTVLLIGSIFVDLVSHMMLMHICKSKMKPSERYFAYLMIIMPVLKNISLDDSQVEQSFIYILATLSALYTFKNIYCMCIEVAAELNIWIFSIKNSL